MSGVKSGALNGIKQARDYGNWVKFTLFFVLIL